MSNRMTAERRAEIKAYLLGMSDLGMGSELLAELEAVEARLNQQIYECDKTASDRDKAEAERDTLKKLKEQYFQSDLEVREQRDALLKSLLESQEENKWLIDVLGKKVKVDAVERAVQVTQELRQMFQFYREESEEVIRKLVGVLAVYADGNHAGILNLAENALDLTAEARERLGL